jgi:hypothetical protein
VGGAVVQRSASPALAAAAGRAPAEQAQAAVRRALPSRVRARQAVAQALVVRAEQVAPAVALQQAGLAQPPVGVRAEEPALEPALASEQWWVAERWGQRASRGRRRANVRNSRPLRFPAPYPRGRILRQQHASGSDADARR